MSGASVSAYFQLVTPGGTWNFVTPWFLNPRTLSQGKAGTDAFPFDVVRNATDGDGRAKPTQPQNRRAHRRAPVLQGGGGERLRIRSQHGRLAKPLVGTASSGVSRGLPGSMQEHASSAMRTPRFAGLCKFHWGFQTSNGRRLRRLRTAVCLVPHPILLAWSLLLISAVALPRVADVVLAAAGHNHGLYVAADGGVICRASSTSGRTCKGSTTP